MPKMNFKNFSKVFIVIAILVSAFGLGWISRSNFETRKGAVLVRLQYLDEEIAVKRVRQIPDVREFVDKNKLSGVEVEKVDKDFIYVRVYSFSDKDIYTETYIWYIYDRNTGKVTETEMFY